MRGFLQVARSDGPKRVRPPAPERTCRIGALLEALAGPILAAGGVRIDLTLAR